MPGTGDDGLEALPRIGVDHRDPAAGDPASFGAGRDLDRYFAECRLNRHRVAAGDNRRWPDPFGPDGVVWAEAVP